MKEYKLFQIIFIKLEFDTHQWLVDIRNNLYGRVKLISNNFHGGVKVISNNLYQTCVPHSSVVSISY